MRNRFTRRHRRVAVSGLCFLLLPIGIAHLAQNSVATSYVGETGAAVSIAIDPELDARPANVNFAQVGGKDYYHFTDMMATLTNDGHGIDGETIVFTVDGHELCTVQTNGGGHATCDAKFAVDQFSNPLPLTYTATFAGDPPLSGTPSDGALTITGNGRDDKQVDTKG